MGVVVARVGRVLGRAHALFGDPPSSGASAASGSGARLADAGDVVGSGRVRMAGSSGRLAGEYGVFAAGSGQALDRWAGADEGLGARLGEAAGADRGGRSASGAVVDAAAGDAAGLAPLANTPAGQRALLVALRARVAQQHKVVAAYRARDARLAALLRTMTYPGHSGVSTAHGRGFSLSPPGLPGLPALSRPTHRPPTTLTSRGYAHQRAAALPAGPGGMAAHAALSRQGAPYVWGAKGPNRFDCSGLTEWAWRQAGVQLGPDTYTQFRQGIPVPPGQIRAGDLIFPKYSFDGRGPGHVQLAISPTEVVHAPQSGDVVRVAPMPSSYVALRPVPLR
ncbi:hypothetical protein MBRA_52560 (plasmid) [Mycobacterium branderi]|uniref:NlpC/P60 domain-containing protein n=1 Tax=Mycobacterium branderi TaxID=43348 RepID=A0ABN6BEL5_9MYCO|nr:hypothetical protein MBRA_52560 [Mycobacterium branderi]